MAGFLNVEVFFNRQTDKKKKNKPSSLRPEVLELEMELLFSQTLHGVWREGQKHRLGLIPTRPPNTRTHQGWSFTAPDVENTWRLRHFVVLSSLILDSFCFGFNYFYFFLKWIGSITFMNWILPPVCTEAKWHVCFEARFQIYLSLPQPGFSLEKEPRGGRQCLNKPDF